MAHPISHSTGHCRLAALHRHTAGRLARTTLLLAGALTVGNSSHAVPVFARKYQTSCQTCHVVFPKLTPFGEAFRRNGYRFPGGQDEDTRKDDVVELGKPVLASLFPSTVWPGDLPAIIPMAAQLAMPITYSPTAGNKVSFVGVGGSVGLNLALTVGDWLAGWAGLTLRAGELATGGEAVSVSMERIFLVISPLDSSSLNLRLGRIEPGVMASSMHRTLGPTPWMLMTPVGDDRFSLEPTQLGAEATGVLAKGRFAYAVGVVEGGGNVLNTAKDVYGRIGYKLGGMRLDGIGGAREADPWRETSLQFGSFIYRGFGTVGVPGQATQYDPFWMTGVDAIATWRDVQLTLGFVGGLNERPLLATPAQSVVSRHAFGQLDYVLFPWLVPTLRLEHKNVGGVGRERGMAGVSVLFRSNVRAQLLAVVDESALNFTFTQAIASINLAF